MIYLWHLFIQWSLAYPMSAMIADYIIGCAFLVIILFNVIFSRKFIQKNNKLPDWYKNLNIK